MFNSFYLINSISLEFDLAHSGKNRGRKHGYEYSLSYQRLSLRITQLVYVNTNSYFSSISK